MAAVLRVTLTQVARSPSSRVSACGEQIPKRNNRVRTREAVASDRWPSETEAEKRDQVSQRAVIHRVLRVLSVTLYVLKFIDTTSAYSHSFVSRKIMLPRFTSPSRSGQI